MRITREGLLHLLHEAVHAAAHARVSGRQPHARVRWDRNYDCNIASMPRSSSRPTPTFTQMEMPSSKQTSISSVNIALFPIPILPGPIFYNRTLLNV